MFTYKLIREGHRREIRKLVYPWVGPATTLLSWLSFVEAHSQEDHKPAGQDDTSDSDSEAGIMMPPEMSSADVLHIYAGYKLSERAHWSYFTSFFGVHRSLRVVTASGRIALTKHAFWLTSCAVFQAE